MLSSCQKTQKTTGIDNAIKLTQTIRCIGSGSKSKNRRLLIQSRLSTQRFCLRVAAGIKSPFTRVDDMEHASAGAPCALRYFDIEEHLRERQPGLLSQRFLGFIDVPRR